jgi:serine/threonine-protein kinase RsbW
MSSTSPADERTLVATLPSSLEAYQDYVQDVHMALEESISNAIRHGNKEDASKQVSVECRLAADRFWTRICDEGPGFCLEDVPDCCAPERLEVPGGRGLLLIKAYMTRVEYNACGNCVTLEKRLPK